MADGIVRAQAAWPGGGAAAAFGEVACKGKEVPANVLREDERSWTRRADGTAQRNVLKWTLKSQNRRGWKGPQEIIGSNSPAKAGSLEQAAQGLNARSRCSGGRPTFSQGEPSLPLFFLFPPFIAECDIVRSPARPGLAEWQHSLLACRPLLPALYHGRTCGGWTLFAHQGRR
nr:uncharacterized protein LOC113841927 isoform X2 [Anas platyrhynchos]